MHRCHYRGRLETTDESRILPLMAQCEAAARSLIDKGKLMTTALYYHGRQVFLYNEAIGEKIEPESFMGTLHPLLARWPQKESTATGR